MKKILLTLVGLVGLTMGSWGQVQMNIPPDWASSLNFTNYSLTRTDGSTFDPSVYNWTAARALDYGPSYRLIEYRQPAAIDPVMWWMHPPVDGYSSSITVIQTDAGFQVNFRSSAADFSGTSEAIYTGPNLSELTLASSMGVVNPPTTFNPNSFVNGLSASGLPIGGAAQPSVSIPAEVVRTVEGLILQTGEFHVLP